MTDIVLTIKANLAEEHLATFVSFLSKIEELGASGESDVVGLFVGEFAPKFVLSYDGTPVQIEQVKRGSLGYIYDAG